MFRVIKVSHLKELIIDYIKQDCSSARSPEAEEACKKRKLEKVGIDYTEGQCYSFLHSLNVCIKLR